MRLETRWTKKHLGISFFQQCHRVREACMHSLTHFQHMLRKKTEWQIYVIYSQKWLTCPRDWVFYKFNVTPLDQRRMRYTNFRFTRSCQFSTNQISPIAFFWHTYLPLHNVFLFYFWRWNDFHFQSWLRYHRRFTILLWIISKTIIYNCWINLPNQNPVAILLNCVDPKNSEHLGGQ